MNNRCIGHAMLWRRLRTICFGAFVCVLASCTTPVVQPVSPPAEILAGPLIGKTWRVQEITYQGSPVRFDWYIPLHFTFTPTGYLELDTGVWCSLQELPIFYSGTQEYQLGAGAVPAIDCALVMAENGFVDCKSLVGVDALPEACAEAIRPDTERFSEAVRATRKYVVSGDQLTLSGPAADIRLILQTP